ncbi:hypothetical protein EDB19DRAFT_1797911 [Suillus lakei]|nr:hypothetical protein EDB19DRAFT_1797911 [Suillus lakei]
MLRGDVPDNMKNYDTIYPSNFAVTSAQHLDGLARSLTIVPSYSPDHRRPQQPTDHAPGYYPASGGFHTNLECTYLSNHVSFLSTMHILRMIHFLAHFLPHCFSHVLPHCFSHVLTAVNNNRHFKLSTHEPISGICQYTQCSIYNTHLWSCRKKAV